jgi:hypothetical protein
VEVALLEEALEVEAVVHLAAEVVVAEEVNL